MAEFDERTENRFRGLYRLLADHGCIGRQSKTLPYHVTLGLYAPDREEELKGRLAALQRDAKSLPLSFSGIGLFRLDVLFVLPVVTRGFLDLHEPFRDSADGRDWAPHVTLLKDRPDVVLKAVSLLSERFAGHSGRIVAVSLYQFQPTRFIERIELV
jgi:2'-5' RNA ligase